MTDPDPAATDDALFDLPATGPGRHEAAFAVAFTAGQESAALEAIDVALMSVALAGARALDQAETIANPAKAVYPVAQLIGPTREVLESLRMSPSVRESATDDSIKELLRDLGTPTPADRPAPASDPADPGQ